MPKERRERSVSSDRARCMPYSSSSSRAKRSVPNPLENDENIKEWEDARCPVCMEHPHNAILLICSSHGKGCRPFMCDTSYRHSNCFDQFRKSFGEATETVGQQEETPSSSQLVSNAQTPEATANELHSERDEGGLTSLQDIPCENLVKPKMLCPLCRGDIDGWIVVESARHFMNAKIRSCASETCEFTGTYTDLRKHARLVHPLVRPTEADPERQRNWRRLERQRDFGDLISTLNSSFGEESGDGNTLAFDDGGWLTVFFLVRIFRPRSSPRSSSWAGTSRGRAQVTFRRRPSRRLWGETYEGEPDARDDNNNSDGGSPWRHVRRQSTPES